MSLTNEEGNRVIAPHGSELINLLLSSEEIGVVKQQSTNIKLVTLTKRQLCDLELLTNGAYSPLDGFMTQSEYNSVLEDMRLPNGLLWSMPVTFDITKTLADQLVIGEQLGLVDEEGFLLAVMEVEDIWQIDKAKEAFHVYGNDNIRHPSVKDLYTLTKDYYVGGKVKSLQLPIHYDFEILRDSPLGLRNRFKKLGWNTVVAFGTGKPMHKIHYQITLDVAESLGSNILIHPLVGLGKPGDLEYFSRVHCYQAILGEYPAQMAALSLLPYSTRMAGPRESIHNAIIRQNYGCSHIIIGPEHGSPPETRQGGERFYERYSAQELIAKYVDELDIQPVNIEEQIYSPKLGRYLPESEIISKKLDSIKFNDSEFYENISFGREIPEWFTFKKVLDQIKKVFKPRKDAGLTIFFTGLSGSGKSTLAKLLYARFIEQGERPVTLLDGDVVRQHLSSELGFSKEHRDLNVKRIGYVASEINKNGGIAICAPIAPYADVRSYVREINTRYGAFIEIHVATPLNVCEKRDTKGLYEKARRGEIKQFTGISDPYEEPDNPDIRIDTSSLDPTQSAQQIMLNLIREGYIDI